MSFSSYAGSASLFRRMACLAAVAALAVSPASAAIAAEGALPNTSEGVAGGPYNVILYVLDTVRADHLGLYGYQRDTTPFLDELATEGVRWNDFRASSSWTWPSVVSILTSQNLRTHRSYNFQLTVHPGWETLPEILKAEGYSTGSFSSNRAVNPAARLGPLFDFSFRSNRPDQIITDQLAGAIRDQAGDPFFFYVHPYAAHIPYEVPEGPFKGMFVGDEFYDVLDDVPGVSGTCLGGIKENAMVGDETDMDWYVAEFDALIAYMDDQIRQLFDVLAAEGLRENTLVFITADHGEEMAGDHGWYFCHSGHYEGVMKIPAMLILPEAFQREFGPFRDLELGGSPDHADIMPTILQVLGIEGPPGMQGTSLLKQPRPVRSLGSDGNRRSYQAGDLKVLHKNKRLEEDPNLELYDLSTDPEEQNDLAGILPETASQMQAELLFVSTKAEEFFPPQEPTGVIFETDFEDPEMLENGEWFLLSESPAGSWIFDDDQGNGVLRGILAVDGAITATMVLPPLNDYNAQVRVKLVEGTLKVTTLWNKTWDQGYHALIEEDTLTLIRTTLDSGVETLGKVAFGFGLDVWRTVRLESDGQTIRLLVDGEVVVTGQQADPRSMFGTMEVSILGQGQALIDDLEVAR